MQLAKTYQYLFLASALTTGCYFSVLSSTYAADPQSLSLKFSMPIDCDYGKTCFIQNYVDMNSSKPANTTTTTPTPTTISATDVDYTCDNMTYHEHNGTDFRLIDYKQMEQGVKVLAAATGTIKAVRDSEDDFAYKELGAYGIKDKACGNGVVITHANGFETQYCHLKRNSVAVQVGQSVQQGEVLGQVGMSGKTEFPHLHISIKQNDQALDPFTGVAPKEDFACVPQLTTATNATPNTTIAVIKSIDQMDTSNALWDSQTLQKLTYIDMAILNFHITDQMPQPDLARKGYYRENEINSTSKYIILWVDIMSPNKNDKLVFNIVDQANKVVLNNSRAVDKNLAQSFMYVGKKLGTTKLDPGIYTAKITIYRENNQLLEQQKQFTVK